MAVDFSKILAKQATEIEKPAPLPIGSYLINNPALPQFKGLGKEESPAAVFSVVILSPGEDVDPEALAEYENGGKRPWKGKKVTFNRFLTEASEFRTKEEICNAFGIEEEGKSLGQIFNETVNKQCMIHIKHRPSDDGTQMYMEVEKLAAV